MNKDNEKEIFPVVDEEGHVVGSAPRGECHSGSKLLHPVVHLHLFDTSGRLYLQKRPDWKDIQPGKWDTAVGGHVGVHEVVFDALHREALEELGLTFDTARLLARYVFESDRERELIYAFSTITDTQPQPSDELDGGRFWTLDEIKANLGRGVFTPNFEAEFTRLFDN